MISSHTTPAKILADDLDQMGKELSLWHRWLVQYSDELTSCSKEDIISVVKQVEQLLYELRLVHK